MKDLILVGGGLAGGLLALWLAKRQPHLEVLLLEQQTTLGGHHTWSFHGPDLNVEQMNMLQPMLGHSWPASTVHFQTHSRTLQTSYHSIRSEDFHRVLLEQLPSNWIRLGSPAEVVQADRVYLQDGTELQARVVLDARGPQQLPGLGLGWQKFVGLDLELKETHGLEHPIIMDARVSQLDGYRFVYCLPWSPKELLIEDTYYSDGSTLEPSQIEGRVLEYAKKQSWKVHQILRRESGSLPILLAGKVAELQPKTSDTAPVMGLRAGFFHPTTGYSLPDAVRLAENLTLEFPRNQKEAREALLRHAQEVDRRNHFFRFLNRMLFRGSETTKRHQVLSQFYKRSETLIERFYAGQLRGLDYLRLLSGKPPIPIRRALQCIRESSALPAESPNDNRLSRI